MRVPPPLYFVAAFMAGIALEAFVPIEDPAGQISLGIIAVALVLWLLLDGAAMLAFSRVGTNIPPMRPSTSLVTSGPYRFTRNPMYLGMAFLYVALALGTGVIWALPLLPVALVLIDRLVIAREEPYLERRFGQAYRDYRSRVRRWI